MRQLWGGKQVGRGDAYFLPHPLFCNFGCQWVASISLQSIYFFFFPPLLALTVLLVLYGLRCAISSVTIFASIPINWCFI